jgi:uncharacterized RDD family membrane protein YckC
MQWHYSNQGNKVGPVTPLAFETLLRDRIVSDQTLVWTSGFTEWQPWSKAAPETAVCAASGGRCLQREMVPYEGKFISAEHKEEFFQRLREGVVVPGRMEFGGFWIRFVAKFIDGLIVGVFNLAVNLLMAYLILGAATFQPRIQPGAQVGIFLAYQGSVLLLNSGARLLYEWFFLSRYAATPGKMALGLKIVRSDGSPLTTGRIIGRYFAEILSALILLIGYIVAGFDEQKRALHDHICDTRVIRAK